MTQQNIPFNTNLVDSIDSYIDQFEGQLFSSLNLIASAIRDGMQEEMSARYNSPQSKSKGFPIKATGELGSTIDNDGNWRLEISINDFGSLIDDESRDALKSVGCPLVKKLATIEGEVIPPTVSGDVSGKLSCKVLLVTVGTLEVSGTLAATK